jgi:hypothetical protein
VIPVRPTIRPSGWWFVAAGAIGLVGIAVALGLVVRGVVTMTDTIDDFDRATMPAILQVDIDEPGGYTIYHEVESGPADHIWWGTPDLAVTGPGGAPVDLEPYDGVVIYDFGGHDGEAVYSFTADEAGTYTVDASMLRPSQFGVDVVAVGPGLGGGLVGNIVAAVIVGLLACVAGTVLAIVVGVRRGRSRRAQLPVPPVPGYGPPPPGYGAPPWVPASGAPPGYRPAPDGWGTPGPAAPPAASAPPPPGGPPPPPAGSWAPVDRTPQDAPPPTDAR